MNINLMFFYNNSVAISLGERLFGVARERAPVDYGSSEQKSENNLLEHLKKKSILYVFLFFRFFLCLNVENIKNISICFYVVIQKKKVLKKKKKSFFTYNKQTNKKKVWV